MNEVENTYSPKAYILSVETYEKAEEATTISMQYSRKNKSILERMTREDQREVKRRFYIAEHPEKLAMNAPEEILKMDFPEVCKI